jgi:hypothetical protein
MKSVSGNENIYKLTQKYRSETQNADETTITNLYLTKEEHKLLESLDGKMIKKKRYPYSVQNQNFSIDVFEGRHQGLILAEMEFEKSVNQANFLYLCLRFRMSLLIPFSLEAPITMTDEEFRQGLLQRLRDHQSFSKRHLTQPR